MSLSTIVCSNVDAVGKAANISIAVADRVMLKADVQIVGFG
jgi:hypothetical protein